jgi:hypothetical protein
MRFVRGESSGPLGQDVRPREVNFCSGRSVRSDCALALPCVGRHRKLYWTCSKDRAIDQAGTRPRTEGSGGNAERYEITMGMKVVST